MTLNLQRNDKGKVHLDNGDGFPACGGNFGREPFKKVRRRLSCDKCQGIDKGNPTPKKSASTDDKDETVTVVTAEETTVSEKTSSADVQDSTFTVTFTAEGQPSIVISGITAESHTEAVSKARSAVKVTVEETRTSMWTAEL